MTCSEAPQTRLSTPVVLRLLYEDKTAADWPVGSRPSSAGPGKDSAKYKESPVATSEIGE